MTGFMIKATVIPFHFASADAHTVAPTPVLVLLSGILTGLGIYAIGRIYWTVFSGVLGSYNEVTGMIFLITGVLTALNCLWLVHSV